MPVRRMNNLKLFLFLNLISRTNPNVFNFLQGIDNGEPSVANLV